MSRLKALKVSFSAQKNNPTKSPAEYYASSPQLLSASQGTSQSTQPPITTWRDFLDLAGVRFLDDLDNSRRKTSIAELTRGLPASIDDDGESPMMRSIRLALLIGPEKELLSYMRDELVSVNSTLHDTLGLREHELSETNPAIFARLSTSERKNLAELQKLLKKLKERSKKLANIEFSDYRIALEEQGLNGLKDRLESLKQASAEIDAQRGTLLDTKSKLETALLRAAEMIKRRDEDAKAAVEQTKRNVLFGEKRYLVIEEQLISAESEQRVAERELRMEVVRSDRLKCYSSCVFQVYCGSRRCAECSGWSE